MQNSNRSISILYEDQQLIVFDKPPGIPVIPTPDKSTRAFTEIVNDEFKSASDSINFYPCHRIDQDTSGAIIYAKGKKNQKLMMALFEQREVKKEYIAFVHGTFAQTTGQIQRPVVGFDKQKFRFSARAKMGLTKYKVLEQHEAFSVVTVEPVTGRTNQIRIHFSQIKHPLVGERKYAFAKDYPLKFKRTCLHAHHYQWTNPVTKTKINVQSELANDMEVFLARNANSR